MCLLVFMPEGKTASKSSLENASWTNDDGFGWAIRAPDRIIVGKSMSFETAYDEFISARSSYNGDALFHLRITTQGGTTLENCHPFYVGKDQLSVVAHNGMLPVADDKTGRSDTRIFAETLLPKRGGIAFLNGDEPLKQLNKWAEGSKLVFLTANPVSKWRYVIVGMDDGHWGTGEDDGVWFSNSSYKYTRPTYYGGWKSGAWDNTAWDYTYSESGGYSVFSYKGKEGTTNTTSVSSATTRDTLTEALGYELQHHAYEIAESLIEASNRDDVEPDELENTYFNVGEELLLRFEKIYTPHDTDTYKATCRRCGHTMYLDLLDIPATHCSECDCCLYCGSDAVTEQHPADCCDWPMGYTMSYAPSVVTLEACEAHRKEDDKYEETAALFG